jgi:glutamate synthase (NADPH/NADH) large chain
MSGGIAYVYDHDGTFPDRVNGEMVDLDALDDEDRALVRTWVRRHQEETDSAVADRLLAHWATLAERFVKVMPKDYKRVRAAERAARERGDDVIDAIMAAAHG